MAKSLCEFRRIDGLSDVFVAENGALRCSAIRLKTGDLCLFSPVSGLGEAAVASLAKLGKVTFLLAPNHYHNKALAEYRAAFPDACLCAPPAARPRLTKITGFTFSDLDALATTLPDSMEILTPEGLKTGEIWIRFAGQKQTGWLVVDAFCGPKHKPNVIADEPEMLGTFPKFGVADRPVYLRWLERQLGRDKPTTLVPCHGNIVHSPDLPMRLRALATGKI